MGLANSPNLGGVEELHRLFTNEAFIKALGNTIKFSALYVPGVVIVSLLVAVLLNRKIRGAFSGRFTSCRA